MCGKSVNVTKNVRKKEESTVFAKEWLVQLLTDPTIQNPCPTKVIVQAAQAVGVKKGELKQARKEAGVTSFNTDGVQYWYLPEDKTHA